MQIGMRLIMWEIAHSHHGVNLLPPSLERDEEDEVPEAGLPRGSVDGLNGVGSPRGSIGSLNGMAGGVNGSGHINGNGIINGNGNPPDLNNPSSPQSPNGHPPTLTDSQHNSQSSTSRSASTSSTTSTQRADPGYFHSKRPAGVYEAFKEGLFRDHSAKESEYIESAVRAERVEVIEDGRVESE